MSKPILWIVIPCYNEEAVLPITAPLFLQKINDLAARGLVSDRSRVLFVNDGSRDKTWELIQGFAKQDEHFAPAKAALHGPQPGQQCLQLLGGKTGKQGGGL